MKAKPAKTPGRVLLEFKQSDDALLNDRSVVETTPALRMKTILVPMDFSNCARKALQYAIPLARQQDASITLLYVAPNPAYAAGEYGGFDHGALVSEMRASGEKQLTALVAGEIKGQLPVETMVRSGSPAAEIVSVASSLPADLIVISTHGHTGLKQFLLGSVAEHVVRRAPCPVLVVREREHECLASLPSVSEAIRV